MELLKYGVKLKKLTSDKIEMVRTWRNDPKISIFMEYKELITPEMQIKWFEKVTKQNDYYFIIEYEGKEVGLSNVKDINESQNEGESGIFIYDTAYLNSDLPYRAVLCLNDYFFETLNFNRLVGHVLSNNKRAIRFNKSIGACPIEDKQNLHNQFWVTERESYLSARQRVLKLLKLNYVD